ncbi:stage III sporulation protein AG [Effusibacillus lacus]|uniref:Stage III sporulation protein AG n=1 Tax=Effusibacillus lacus TaxID=1348429 RepID=A0A292YIK8_9BACL|nr:stage III sporulation protein AG [Effusibacillus lacus]TCS72530.1 stage III sporulation protein AG [Effusibacillus lacus]GAX90907.1 stage III sporulation protein AG [Effusibacillus lacus]
MNIDLSKVPKWTYAVGALGIALLLFGTSLDSPGPPPKQETAQQTKEIHTDRMSISGYERLYEEKLAQVLNQIQGVADVTVMVNLESTEEIVLAENTNNQRTTTTENDKQGGTRTITAFNENKQLVMTKGSPDNPVVVRTIKPHVRGVLVVARGAEQPRVKAMILETVQRVLEVPAHRIAVEPKKAN